MSARVNLRHREATFSPLGRRWGGGAHGGPIVRFAAKRWNPFDPSIQIETMASGAVASGFCTSEQLQCFARELQRLLTQTAATRTTDAFFEPPPANDDEASPSAARVHDSLFSGVRTLLVRHSSALRELFSSDDGATARADLSGEMDGRTRRVVHVSLRETPANRILRVELCVGEQTVRAFSNPQAIRAFLEELREADFVGA